MRALIALLFLIAVPAQAQQSLSDIYTLTLLNSMAASPYIPFPADPPRFRTEPPPVVTSPNLNGDAVGMLLKMQEVEALWRIGDPDRHWRRW